MIDIRPLVEDEGPGLAHACAAIDPWRRLGITAAGLADWLTRPDPALRRLALLRQGQVAGVLAVRSPWLRGPFIEALAVLPPWQGAGLGRAAVAWAATQACGSGARNLWASVSDFNRAGRAFWAGQGFIEVAPLDGLLRADGVEFLLRKPLG